MLCSIWSSAWPRNPVGYFSRLMIRDGLDRENKAVSFPCRSIFETLDLFFHCDSIAEWARRTQERKCACLHDTYISGYERRSRRVDVHWFLYHFNFDIHEHQLHCCDLHISPCFICNYWWLSPPISETSSRKSSHRPFQSVAVSSFRLCQTIDDGCFPSSLFHLAMRDTLKLYNNFVIKYPLLSMALTTGLRWCHRWICHIYLCVLKARPWDWVTSFLRRWSNISV